MNSDNKPALVSVVKVQGDVLAAVKKAMELARWQDFIPRGAAVALKPNLGWDLFFPGAVTSPWVVEGVITTIKEHVGQIYVVEAGQVLVDVEKAVRQTGVLALCEKYRLPWINMSKGKFVKVKLDNGLIMKELAVPEILTRTTLITIPVMKTHGKTTITGSIKNQWGCLPEFRHNYHPVVNQVLVDINLAVKPRFTVVDGTIGMEGNGPKSGSPKIADLIMASGDIVAADTVMTRLMGFEPGQIKMIANCAKAGLGEADETKIKVVGADIRGVNLHFKPAKHNTVSLVEQLLRQSKLLRWVIFHTFVLKLCCWGALLWYYIWYYIGPGKRMKDQVLRHPLYGKQWR